MLPADVFMQAKENENTPATIEADQFWLALTSWRVITTLIISMIIWLDFPSCWGHSARHWLSLTENSTNFELFEDCFWLNPNLRNQLTVDNRINYFYFFMRRDALHTFKFINSLNWESLVEFLAFVLKKYVKSQSTLTAKMKIQKLIFKSENRKVIDLRYGFQKRSKNALGRAAHAMIEQFKNSRKPITWRIHWSGPFGKRHKWLFVVEHLVNKKSPTVWNLLMSFNGK